jgi:hypothetical protein
MLLVPFQNGRHWPEHALVDGIAALFHGWQQQQFLLDIGREVVEIHDLRHPGLGDVRQAGHFGLVPYLPVPQQPVEPNRQGHQLGDSRDSPRRGLLGPVCSLGHFLPAERVGNLWAHKVRARGRR